MLINGARITRANLGASNGIIHVLDSVLMPSKLSAMEVLAKNEDTSLFRKALVMSGIKIPDGYTVLAPTNKAFNNMDSALFERLLKSPMCLKVSFPVSVFLQYFDFQSLRFPKICFAYIGDLNRKSECSF